jgi:hypothetical protein
LNDFIPSHLLHLTLISQFTMASRPNDAVDRLNTEQQPSNAFYAE